MRVVTHRSHLCHGCGHIWRPADVPTEGVAHIETVGLNDSPALIRSAPDPGREEIEDAVEGLVMELMQAVHVHYQADEDPDFGEYARDYTCAILALFHAPADPGGGEAEGAVRTAGAKLLTALERYGFPVSDAASTAAMSVEARDLHNAARRFKIAITSTRRAADEPAVTNGQ